MSYVGRFAPSPTGPPHAGSIATAVASYLHARQSQGEWLLRIDDVDPPRIIPGSAESFISLLERLELHWDRTVYYQSERHQAHTRMAAALLEQHDAYRCDCSRRRLRQFHKTGPLGLPYDGHCRDRNVMPEDSAIRVKVKPGLIGFRDRLQGAQSAELSEALGDYIIYRRDELPAYHLATVMDDVDQGITDIVRGSDLLGATLVQIHLAKLLGLPEATYWHLPVLCDTHGEKLAKQHSAASVESIGAAEIAFAALQHIGANPPAELRGEAPGALWRWGQSNWRIESLAGQMQRRLDSQ